MTKLKSIIFNDKELSCNIDGTKIYYNGNIVNQVLLKSKKSNNGFYVCSLDGNKMYTHRIVAMVYVPNHNNKPNVCHLDTNTINNHYKNLAWGDRYLVAQNLKVAQKVVGSESKIPEKDIPVILERLRNGEFSRTIAKEYNTSEMSVIRLKRKNSIETNITPVYDDVFKMEVIEHLKKHHSIKLAALRFDVRTETLWRWNKVWQIPIYRQIKLTPLVKEQIKQELISGKTFKEVCLEFEDVCSSSTVYKIYNSK